MSKPLSNSFKQSELAKIHIAKKELGLDDDTYRAMLQHIGGVSSSKDLNALGRAKVLEHLKASGFKVKGTQKDKPNTLGSNSDRSAQIGKIEALLADAKRPWQYAIVMAQHMYSKDRLEFCDRNELAGIITALVKDQRRREVADGEAS